MRRAFQILLGLLLAGAVAQAADQRVIKVLPHLLDKEGRHARSPSLFDRDAYQVWLRDNPDEQSGVRYDVQGRAATPGEYVLKLELLGRVVQGRPLRQTIEEKVGSTRRSSRWSAIEFSGEEYKKFGQVVAWRVTLWRGDEMVARQQSFLWD
ncbi:MAG TPA: hypothetical protein DCY13_14440 [Verrucomicrobiales bacterium]|nr:hypothetical protein [Verrucomicrobiales bacterium]